MSFVFFHGILYHVAGEDECLDCKACLRRHALIFHNEKEFGVGGSKSESEAVHPIHAKQGEMLQSIVSVVLDRIRVVQE
jgi:hypothetical protein